MFHLNFEVETETYQEACQNAADTIKEEVVGDDWPDALDSAVDQITERWPDLGSDEVWDMVNGCILE